MKISGYDCYVVARRDDSGTPDNIFTTKAEAEIELARILEESKGLKLKYPKANFDYSVLTLDYYLSQIKSNAAYDAQYPENEW